MGIKTRVNGQPPPDIALEDIDLGNLEFWALDDAIRDGAFATLRRQACAAGQAKLIGPAQRILNAMVMCMAVGIVCGIGQAGLCRAHGWII